MKIIENRNYKILIGFLLGFVASGVVVYAATVGGDKVSYDNSKSGMQSTTLQGALDELYAKVPKKKSNFKIAYTYSETSCISGTESTCVETNCYQNKSANSCPPGTIIKYNVNDSSEYTFNVIEDKGDTIVMQANVNMFPSNNVCWDSTSDVNVNGPITALQALEEATRNWTNVETQNCVIGNAMFETKSRMITKQEASDLGCKTSSNSCPKWMKASGNGYWTMTASADESNRALILYGGSYFYASEINYPHANVRPVVVVFK